MFKDPYGYGDFIDELRATDLIFFFFSNETKKKIFLPKYFIKKINIKYKNGLLHTYIHTYNL